MAALLEREQYIERRPLTRGYIMPIIGPSRRPPAVFPQHFEPFAWAGLSLTGIGVGLSHGVAGESGTLPALRAAIETERRRE